MITSLKWKISTMFEKIVAAPADPILGLGELFLSDPRPHKINLGIGVYKDENGQIPLLDSVKKTEHYLLENVPNKNYLSIEGIAEYATGTQVLLFGTNSDIIKNSRARTAQTPGGTGALRVAADFLAKQTSVRTVWISNPTWPNHFNTFKAAGLETKQYRYYNAAEHTLDFDAMLADLEHAKTGDVILFHGCCHNPTGIDPTIEQWRILADMAAERGWLPFFDFAYQGFASGLEEDAQGLRIFAEKNQEIIIASSYSKNFGLYGERVGACTLVAADSRTADAVFSQLKASIRANYSNPPIHGGAIVATILGNVTLRSIWEEELTVMRQRIHRMRQLFVSTLQDKNAKHDYSFIARQNGMFSFSGLTKDQILRLRDEYAIYAVESGRINVAGMTLDNMAYLCEAIIAVE